MSRNIPFNPNLQRPPQGGNNGSTQTDSGLDTRVHTISDQIVPTQAHQFGTQFYGDDQWQFLVDVMNSGMSINSEAFQKFFEMLWNRDRAMETENWARQDAWTDWQRSLASADYNAQLGLETAQAGRSQLYNQLIAMGMSPAAAMQAATGLTNCGSAGAGGAGASKTSTASVAASGQGVGDTVSAQVNAAANIISGLSQVAQTAGGMVAQFQGLRQQNDQFYAMLPINQQNADTQKLIAETNQARLDFDRSSFNSLQSWPIAINTAAVSSEASSYAAAVRDAYVSGELSTEDMYSRASVLKAISSAKAGSKAYAAYQAYLAGEKVHGQAWNPGIDSNHEFYVHSISDELNNKLIISQEATNQALKNLHTATARLTNAEAGITEQVSESQVRLANAANSVGAKRLEMYLSAWERLENNQGKYNYASLVSQLTDSIASDIHIQKLRAELNEIISDESLDWAQDHSGAMDVKIWLDMLLGDLNSNLTSDVGAAASAATAGAALWKASKFIPK